MTSNPLLAYYRQPGMQITIPSKGQYYGHPLETTISGEIPVYPMTATDEIIVNNPDGLINGSSIEQIIKSCCPVIKYPRDLCVADIDVILLAIKLVSFGPKMEIVGVCPKCQKETKFDFNIRDLLDQATDLPELKSTRLNDDLVAYVRPYSFKTSTILNMSEFEEAKLLQNLLADDTNEEKRINALSESFRRLTDLSLSVLYQSVMKISTPSGDVSDETFIRNFLNNTSADIVKKIQKKQEELNKYGMPKTQNVVCSNDECEHHWDLPIVYDPSSFFA